MKCIELYKEYLKNIDMLRNKLGEKLKAKEEKDQKKIIYIKSDIRKLKYGFIIACALMMIALGPTYAIMNQYFNLIYLLYYLLIVIVVCMVFLGLYINFINKIKEIRKNNMQFEQEDDLKFINEYQKASEEIYQITLLIICINEYYYDLIKLKNKDLINYYNKISLLRRESINYYLNYNITVDGYKTYLDNWIEKNQEKE